MGHMDEFNQDWKWTRVFYTEEISWVFWHNIAISNVI